MNSSSRSIAFVLVFALCSLFVSSASAAQTEAAYPAEFREKFTSYMSWLDSNTSQNKNLAGKVQAMTDEEFQALYDAFSDPDAFVASSDKTMAAFQTQSATPFGAFAPQAAASTILYSPAYPEGTSYNDWVLTLPGLGLLSDEDGDGTTANDRCTWDGEAQLAIVGSTLDLAAIAGDTLCNSIEGGIEETAPKIIACVAAGVLNAAAYANQIVQNQCSFQDGSVDTAEIEAAYENSKIIGGQIDNVSSQVNNVSTQLTDVSVQLTDIAVQIEGVSSQIDGVSNQIKDVSTQLATHDAEVKAILQANHTETINLINANQAQSLKIEIEKALADTNDNKRLSYFYLPQAQGGLLELVRQTVLEAINANQAAGIPVGNAQSWFAKANASFASQQYKTAFDLYGKAYVELVK